MNILLFVKEEKLYKVMSNIVDIMFTIEKNRSAWSSYHVYTNTGKVVPDDRYTYDVLYEI